MYLVKFNNIKFVKKVKIIIKYLLIDLIVNNIKCFKLNQKINKSFTCKIIINL